MSDGTIVDEQQLITSDESYVFVEQPVFTKVLSHSDTENKLRCHILQELTNCTEDQAITALYDCENNIERAAELVLDKFRCGVEEEWHMTVNKKGKHKNEVAINSKINDVSSKKLSTKQQKFEKHLSIKSNDEAMVKANSTSIQKNNTSEGKAINRNRRTSAKRKVFTNEKNKGRTQAIERENYTSNSTKESRIKTESDIDDCGVWEGESIEIINSNVSIALGLQEPDTFEKNKEKDEDSFSTDCQSFDDHVRFLAHSADAQDSDSLFTTVAKSSPPPRAFNGLIDSLFIAPEIVANINSKWSHTFGCDAFLTTFSQEFVKHLNRTHTDLPETNPSNHCDQTTRLPSELSDLNSKQFTYTSQTAHPAENSNSFEIKSASALSALLENKNEEKTNSISDYTPRRFEEGVATNVPSSFPNAHKKQNSSMVTGTSATQTKYIEPVIKNYLEGLSENISKLNVSEGGTQNQKATQFVMHQQSQTQQTPISFTHSQGSGVTAAQHPLGKVQMHATTNGPNFSQPITTSQQLPPQQPTTLPPGMPHFISQFAPPAYHMFNLQGNSNTGPALLDLEQLQLLQQQRMLYDMHVQQHSATTSQSMLGSNNDTTSSGKTINHMSGQLGHATAASSAMRPDMLTSAMGHNPQMMAPGHPYFPYSGFVLMNGYPNAFLNQQQQQQQSNSDQNQNSGLCGSPLQQQQQQQQQQQHQQTNQSQTYGNLKQLGGAVNNYEDFLDLNYGDASKQVGFKSNSNQLNYASFQSQNMSVDNVGNKLSSANHSLTQNFNHTNSTHFPPQYYQSGAPTAAASPYLTAVAAAAVAAASAKQVSSNNNNMVANPSGAHHPNGAIGNLSGGGGGSNSNQIHMSGNAAASGLVLGASGGLHHHHQQRAPAISHQH